ncbi:MAG: magnesium/cobalt transporter CorA [Chloroflexi bacterium]|nr:magnesium/cobalt transporter CorA [Chloroflexota bacterium]
MSERHAVAHLRDGTVKEIDPDTILEVLAERGVVLWLDIQDPVEADLALLGAEFGFHELALEDAARRGQRPKVDDYDGYYFIVIYAAAVGPDQRIKTREVHCFWGSNYFVTLHEGSVPEILTAIERWASGHEDRRHGVAYQVYTLFDAVIDAYFPVVDAIAERIDEVEAAVFTAHNGGTIQEMFALRRELIGLRRILAPSRDILNELIRRDVPVFPRSLIPYLADVYDHSIRVMDTVDLQRDLLTTALESQLSVTANHLNQTMRTLTALTVGLMVPTLIAGIYGMNFVNMPELGWEIGYPLSLALMVGAITALWLAFKRKNWL